MFKVSIDGHQYLRRGFSSSKEALFGQSKFVVGLAQCPNGILPLFDDCFMKFFDFYKLDCKRSTYISNFKRFNEYIRGRIPNKSVSELDDSDLKAWRSYLSKYSSSVVDSVWNLMSKFSAWLFDYYSFNFSSFKLLPKIKDYSIKPYVEVRKKTLSVDDLRKFLDSVDDIKLYLLFVVSFVCSLRIGEARGLLRSSFLGDAIVVNRAESYLGQGKSVPVSPKSESSCRKIVLPSSVCSILDSYCRDNRLTPDDYLFFSPRGTKFPLGATTIRRAIEHYCGRAGIPYFRFHSFRHTFATLLVDGGFSVDVVGSFLGHSSSSITKKYYVHCDETDSNRVDKYLDGVFKIKFDR